jgi:hypothetical protein
MKRLLEGIADIWKETPNSIKFWNGLAFLAIGILSFINLEFLALFMGIGSLFFIGLMFDESDQLDKHWWIIVTPLFWLLLVAGLIILIGHLGYEHFIKKFNNWLDGQK